MDLADILAQTIRELHEARFERAAYRGWFCAALDELHEQHREIERQRQQLASQRDEIRQLLRRANEVAA